MTFDTDELHRRIDALAAGDPLESVVGDLNLPRLPGAGWVLVDALESNGALAVMTLFADPLLDKLRPDLEALNGRGWSGAADLKKEQALSAARVDAVMGVEWLSEIAERYRVPEEELTEWEMKIRSDEGIPEEILGVTATFRYAG